MFGLYPAGHQWTSLVDCQRDVILVARDLATFAGLVACVHHEPFGHGRGCLIAQNNHILVLSNLDKTQLAIVPNIASQYLIWSSENGLKDQWSQQEITTLVLSPDWDSFFRLAREQLLLVTEQVRLACAGTLGNSQSQTEAPSQSSGAPEKSDGFADYEAEAALWEANQQETYMADRGHLS